MDMSDISPFTPKREEKQRKEASTEKASGREEVVLVEEAMTDLMHPRHNEARKVVEAADDAYVGSPEQITELVSQAAEKDMAQDITVFGGTGEAARKAEKAGLAPEMNEEGSLIQDAIEEDENGEETGKTWGDSPFSPGANR